MDKAGYRAGGANGFAGSYDRRQGCAAVVFFALTSRRRSSQRACLPDDRVRVTRGPNTRPPASWIDSSNSRLRTLTAGRIGRAPHECQVSRVSALALRHCAPVCGEASATNPRRTDPRTPSARRHRVIHAPGEPDIGRHALNRGKTAREIENAAIRRACPASKRNARERARRRREQPDVGWSGCHWRRRVAEESLTNTTGRCHEESHSPGEPASTRWQYIAVELPRFDEGFRATIALMGTYGY